MDILILLLLIHVCGAKYHMERSTRHVMWWALPLGSVGVPLGFTRSGECSNVSHRVKYTPRDVLALPLSSVRVPLGSTRCILPGTQMVYGAKYHTEQSTHYVMWWALPLGFVGVPLGSITLWPWFSCSHVHMFSCSHVLLIPVLNETQYTISTIPTIIMFGAYIIR